MFPPVSKVSKRGGVHTSIGVRPIATGQARSNSASVSMHIVEPERFALPRVRGLAEALEAKTADVSVIAAYFRDAGEGKERG